jgi:hypothetical protein
MDQILIEYDCGSVYRRPTVLEDPETMLHHSKLVDQIVWETDRLHEEECKVCT